MRFFTFKTSSAQAGLRLDNLLTDVLNKTFRPQIFSKGEIKKLILEEHLFIDSSLCKICSKTIKKGVSISIWLPQVKAKLTLTEKDVVYQDDDLIILNKPSGFPTQATLDPRKEHLFAATIAFLSRNLDRKLAYVGLHHRLDQETSGLVIMTKRKSANKGVTELFRQRSIKKTYLAVVDKKEGLEEKWSIKNHLAKKPQKHHRFFFASVNSSGQLAETHFEKLKSQREKQLLLARPITGRTHQIRVHLSEMGLPIWGDRVYGHQKTEDKASRLLLHCQKLEFNHPQTGQKMAISAPIPKEFD